jgi:hypothetical protein
MEYGELLAQTYNLPQRQQRAVGMQPRAQRQPAAQQDLKLPDFLDKQPEGLQYITPKLAERSQQVFKEWADLRGYAKNMWLKYKIDITAPDPSNQDAVWAHQAFQQRINLLLSEIDTLKTGREDYKTAMAAAARGEILPTEQFGTAATSEIPLTQQFAPTAVDPGAAKFIEKQMGIGNITQAQSNLRNAQRDLEIKRFEDLAKTDPNNAAYYNNQAAILRRQMSLPAENTPRGDYDYGAGSAVFGLMTKVAEAARGVDGSYQDTGRVDTKSKQRIFESTNNPILRAVQNTSEMVDKKPVVATRVIGDKLYLINEDALTTGTTTPQNSRAYDPKENGYDILYSAMVGQGLEAQFEKLIPRLVEQGVLRNEGTSQMPVYVLETDKLFPEKGKAARKNMESQLTATYATGVREAQNLLGQQLDEMKVEEGLLAQPKRFFANALGIETPPAPVRERRFTSPTRPGIVAVVKPVTGGWEISFKTPDNLSAKKDGKTITPKKLADRKEVINYISDEFGGLNELILEKGPDQPVTEDPYLKYKR